MLEHGALAMVLPDFTHFYRFSQMLRKWCQPSQLTRRGEHQPSASTSSHQSRVVELWKTHPAWSRERSKLKRYGNTKMVLQILHQQSWTYINIWFPPIIQTTAGFHVQATFFFAKGQLFRRDRRSSCSSCRLLWKPALVLWSVCTSHLGPWDIENFWYLVAHPS